MLTPRQKDLLVEITGGLVAASVGIAIYTTAWPLASKLVATAAVVVAFLAGSLVWNWVGAKRASRQQRAASAAGRQPSSHRAAIDRGWFVTFTSDPDPGGGGMPEYTTAIAEVDGVLDGVATLIWRDGGNLPTRVPLALLEAEEVVRLRTDGDGVARRVRTRNEGLRSHGAGGIVVGNGWRAHRHSPHQLARRRFRDLGDNERSAMEAEADLATYDIDNLK